MKKKLYFTYQPIEAEIAEMERVEFEEIMDDRDTPEFVHITGTDELYYNSYTCLAGFDGTCGCISHQRKRWDLYSLSEMVTPPRKYETPKERFIRPRRNLPKRKRAE